MLSSIGNYYERLVMECLHDAIKERDAFDVGDFDDLACVALNYLPPRYVRHAIDLSSHLSDAEYKIMREEVLDAVSFAIATTHQRRRRDESIE